MECAGVFRRIPCKSFPDKFSVWPAMKFAVIDASGGDDHIE